MPSAPLSRMRVASEYSPFGTRTIGAMPAFQRGDGDLRGLIERQSAVLAVEPEPVITCRLGSRRDLHRAQQAHRKAEGQAAGVGLSGRNCVAWASGCLLRLTCRGSLRGGLTG